METITILFIIYIIFTLSLAWRFRLKDRFNTKKFLINNKQLTTIEMVFSSLASATDISVILFATGIAFIFGPQAYVLYLIMFIQYLVIYFFAPKLWKMAKENNVITTSDIFLKRAGNITNILAALITVFVSFVVLSVAFSANATLLNQIFGWSAIVSVLFSAIIVLVYLWIGGFKTMIKTDVFQMIIMLVILIAPFLITREISFFESFTNGDLLTRAGFQLQMGFWFFNITNIQNWQKIIAAKNEKTAKRGALFTIIGLPLYLLPLIYLSFNIKAALPNITDPQTALFTGMNSLFPTWFTPIILISLYAAMMSSVDTSLFTATINTTENILSKISKKVKDNLILSTRLTLVVILSVSAFFSLKIESAIWFLFNMITILGILCFPLYLSIFRKLSDKLTTFSIVCGLITFGFIQFLSIFQSNFLWKALPPIVTGVVLLLGIYIIDYLKN